MKKLLISIGSLLIMAVIVVLFVNANNSKKDTKKAKAQVEAAAQCCSQPVAETTASCDPATCTAHKEGEKCDPATCTAHAEAAKKEAEACKPSAGCAATCSMTAAK
ncbi:MAG: hypothetical protein MUF36_12040 [Bacteroidales bacterium]|jgi:hypothetical protein|nr:hypothetical protein [Bacteroidales bacterium]